MNKIDKDQVVGICKVGYGEECCSYLVVGAAGFECTKGTELAYSIELRLAEGTMNAKGDNCNGMKEIN